MSGAVLPLPHTHLWRAVGKFSTCSFGKHLGFMMDEEFRDDLNDYQGFSKGCQLEVNLLSPVVTICTNSF
jgi:hypothetical protein